MNKRCTIYLIRHGKSEWNEKGRIGGDSPLSSSGREQAEAIRTALHGILFDAAYSSDVLRTQETAAIVLSGTHICATPLPSLRERFHGEFEGKNRDEIRRQLEVNVMDIEKLSDEEKVILKLNATMETEKEAVLRFEKALKKIAEKHVGKTVLIVTHGNLMRFLLHHYHFGTRETLPASAVKNTGWVKLSVTQDSISIDEVKDVVFSKVAKTTDPAVLITKYL